MTKSEKELEKYREFKSNNFGNRTSEMQKKLEKAFNEIG